MFVSVSAAQPIAIIGIGCRFPGGVEAPQGLWNLAAERRSAVGPVPPDRWDAAALAGIHDPGIARRAAVGCFLEGDVWAWEPEAFSVAPVEQRWVDPQFRLVMETAWEAVEHAGIPLGVMRGTRTGVYVGTYAPDNLFRDARPVQDAPNSPFLFGNFTAGAAGRLAFALDLRGPAMVVSTHCSSGLVALDTACGALTLGECDAALAGGVLLMLSPLTHYMEAPFLLSGSGACRAFDSGADGYVRGEGAGMLLLKRLRDAERDGDRVLAVIRGSTVNNDGQSTRLTAPSAEMQQSLFRDTVGRAAIDPGDVGLIEAHGPGTAVGDPIEYASIEAVYGRGRDRCALGSVKTNIGHSEPVSGIAGVIKAVECLRRGVIPPNLNFREWNPAIARSRESRLFVPTELTDWPVDGAARLAGVCSYGVTGTNAHVILERAPLTQPRMRTSRDGITAAQDERERLFVLSGRSGGGLREAAARLASWAEGSAGVPGADVAHTLSLRRSHADWRAGIVARDLPQLARRARAVSAGEEPAGTVSGMSAAGPGDPGAVFVFTGQGSQRPGMCRGLLTDESVFAAVIDELETLVHAEARFSLRRAIIEDSYLRGIDRIQPTLFAVQVGLARLWRSWGVDPAAVIGQSLGEVAAAVVAGIVTVEDGVKVICRRSALLATIPGGMMASVMLPADQVQAAIGAAGAHGVSLGVLTSPQSTVISGDAGQVAGLVAGWEAAGIVARMIEVDVASHSPQVDPILDDLRSSLADVPAAEATAGFYSTVSDDPRRCGTLDAGYWARNQRDTVRFSAAVSAAMEDGHRLFIECTPHPLAVKAITDTARSGGVRGMIAAGSLRQGAGDVEAFLVNVGTVHCAGHPVDFTSRYGGGHLADVPVAAWQRTRHRGTEDPYMLVAPQLPAASQHPLLGGHVADPGNPRRHLWQTCVGPGLLPWLADHIVASVPLLPGTGFAEMLLAAGAQVFATRRIAVSGLRIRAPLPLDAEPAVTTCVIVDDHGTTAQAEVVTVTGGATVVHARGTLTPATHGPPPQPLDPAMTQHGQWEDKEPAELYAYLRKRHNVQHGPAFSAIDRIQVHEGGDSALAHVRIDDAARVSAGGMLLHPALADEVVQAGVCAWLRACTLTPGPVVVAGFDEIRVHGPAAHARLAHITVEDADDLSCTASAVLATEDGHVVAEIRRMRLANITPPGQRYASRLSHLAWTAQPPAAAPDGSGQRWLTITPSGTPWVSGLCALLGQRPDSSREFTYPAGAQLDGGSLTAYLDGGITHVMMAINGSHEGQAALAARCVTADVLTVIQQIAATPRPPRLWVISRASEPLTAAGARGLLRVVSYEHPQLRASLIETDDLTPATAVIADLLTTTIR